MLENRTFLKTTLFWVITQQEVIISNRRFGTTYRSHFQASRIQKLFRFLTPEELLDRPLKMGPIGCPKRRLEITTTRCVMTQKSVVLVYLAAEAWNHGRISFLSLLQSCTFKLWQKAVNMLLFTFTAPKLTIMANKIQHPYTRGLYYTFIYLPSLLSWIYFPSLGRQEAIFSPRWLWMGPTRPAGFVTAYGSSPAMLWTALSAVLILHSQISSSSDPFRIS
jgi:hypothetical protein